VITRNEQVSGSSPLVGSLFYCDLQVKREARQSSLVSLTATVLQPVRPSFGLRAASLPPTLVSTSDADFLWPHLVNGPGYEALGEITAEHLAKFFTILAGGRS
jgi:hypothetical protein